MLNLTNMRRVFLGLLVATGVTTGVATGAHGFTQPAFRTETAALVSPSTADAYFGSATTHTDGLGNGTPDEIVALARALGAGRDTDADYADNVFEYVYSNIDVTPLYGLQKGALGAIIDQAGTPFDQAMLMVELLREGAAQGNYASLSARYKAGTITLTGAQFGTWLGITNAKAACQMLADGGIPASVNSASSCTSLSGNVTSVTLSHIWVEAVTSAGTYAYDPSYKEHNQVAGIGLAALRAAMGCAAGDCASAVETQMGGTATNLSGVSGLKNLGKAALGTKLTTYSTNLLNTFKSSHGEKAIEEIISGREVDLGSVPAQATALPYGSSVQHTWTGDIPDQYRTTLRVSVDSINETLYVDEIYGSMLSLQIFQGASWEGELNDFIRYRGVGLVLGETQIASSGATAGPVPTLPVTQTVNHPYAADSGGYMDEAIYNFLQYLPDAFVNAPSATSSASLVNGWGDASYGLTSRYIDLNDKAGRRDHASRTGDVENAQARHVIGAQWQAELADAMAFDSALKGYSVQHHHSLGVIFASYTAGGNDAEMGIQSRLSINDHSASTASAQAAAHGLASIAGALEGGVLRRLSRGTHAGSTQALLDYANDASHEFYFVNAGSYATIKSSLTDYSGGRETLIQNYVDDGYTVLLPRNGEVGCLFGGTAVCLDAAGFIAVKTDGSEVAHIVSFNVGSTVISLKGAGGSGDFSGALSAEIEAMNLSSGGASGGADISVGSQGFPYGLAFQRSYSAGGQGTYHKGTSAVLGTEMGVGWSHNYRSGASFGADGSSGFGRRSIFEATDTIAALITMGDFAGQTKTLSHVLASAFVLNWWELEAEANVVSTWFGGGGARYIKLADGTWSHGMGPGYTLSLTGARRLDTAGTPFYSYDNVDVTLTGLSGETIKFDNIEGAGNVWSLRLTDHDFPSGIDVDYTYATGASGAIQLSSVQNSLGRSLTFAYGPVNGALTGVTTDDGRSVSYAYTGHTCDVADLGLLELTGFTDGVGDTTSYHYEDLSDDATCVGVDEAPDPDVLLDISMRFGMDKMWSAEDTGTPAVTTTYDSLGRMIAVKDAANYETQYYTAALGGERLVRSQVKDPLGNVTTSYASRLVSEAIDAEGKSATTTRDRLGRMVSQSFPNGASTSYSHMGLDGTFDYDSRVNVTGMTVTPASGSGDSPISRAMAWHGDFPVPVWTEDFEGNRTSHTYDAQGRPLSVTLPDDDANGANNPVTSYTYDAATGLPKSRTNAEGIVVETTFDAKANLTHIEYDKSASGLNYVTTIGYSSAGNQTSVDGPKSGTADTTTFTFDNNRRLKQVNDALTGIAKVSYNGRGQKDRIEQWTGSVWQTTDYTYDVRGLPLQVEDPLDQTSALAYTARGQVDVATDAEGRMVKYTYDALGRTTKVTKGYLTAGATDVVTSVYSAVTGQLTSVDDGKGNTTAYAYDGFGRGKTTTWADSSTSSVTYNANGQALTSATRKGDVIAFTYSATGQILTRTADDTLTHVYDIMGRITSITSDSPEALSNAWTYDTAGRVLTAGRQDGKTLAYQYDATGNRTKLTHADGYYVDYVYNALGQMTSVSENGAATALATYGYDPLGRRTDLDRRNGADTSYAFDLANRLTDLDHSYVVSAALEFDYGYNAVSQMTTRTTSNADYIWTPGVSGTQTAAVNEMNELSVFASNTITYDANGNMTSDGSQSYAYNKSNQMVGAFVGASTILYSYDPAGRRVKKDVDGTVTDYLLDGAHEIAEYDGVGTLLRRFIFGPSVDEPIAMVEGSTTTFYHQNHQGSVVALTDAAGTVTQKYTYDAYGASSDTTTGQPFRYTGRRLDPETGLYYYRARYYSPAMGRFMQVDPIGYAAGMNTHAYVGGDPMNKVDPSGLADQVKDPPGDDKYNNTPDEIVVTGKRRKPVTYSFVWIGSGSTTFTRGFSNGRGTSGSSKEWAKYNTVKALIDSGFSVIEFEYQGDGLEKFEEAAEKYKVVEMFDGVLAGYSRIAVDMRPGLDRYMQYEPNKILVRPDFMDFSVGRIASGIGHELNHHFDWISGKIEWVGNGWTGDWAGSERSAYQWQYDNLDALGLKFDHGWTAYVTRGKDGI